MRNENRSVFAMVENYLDMLVNLVAIYVAYFFSCFIEEPTLIPTEPLTVVLILVCVIISSFVYQAFNLYRPSVFSKSIKSLIVILEANGLFFGGALIIAALTAADKIRAFLIVWVLLAFAVSTVFLYFKRRLIISVLAILRNKQFVLKKVIIVGDNTASAKEYVRQVTANPEYGIMILGYVGDKITEDVGCDKLGAFKDLERIFDKYSPTDVVFAIDAYDKRHLIRLVNLCDDRCIKVYFLPVIYGFFKTEKQIEQVGSLPVINIHTTPLDNRANAFIKRLIDIVGSAILIVVTSPLMLIAAIGTRITSPGPILFRQKRVGKLGKPFFMYKFRSMKVNDGSDDTWTTDTDKRKTKFGTFIRRTAIDELPQLFNVLFGSMSLVGPRPEIPKFVAKFKDDIPLYMVKHYVKPGMTGLAQVKGLRGDTSVEDRIHEDIAYIENWSLLLDISILIKTPFKAFNKNEKYIETEIRENPELYGDIVPEMFEIHEALLSEENSDGEAEAETKAEAQGEAIAEAEPTAEAAPEAETKAEAQSEAAAEAEPAAEAAPETETKAEAQGEAAAEAEATAEAEAEPTAEAAPEAETKAEAQSEAETKAEAQSEATAEAAAEPSTEAAPEAAAVAEPDTVAETQLVAEATDTENKTGEDENE